MPPSSTPERLIRIVDEHWMIYVRPIFFSAIVFVASCVCFALGAYAYVHVPLLPLVAFVLGFLLLLLAAHVFLGILISESLSQIVITSRRVVHFSENLPLKTGMMEVSFDKMKTVEVERDGFLPSLLNYGSLNFEKGKAKIHYVPHPSSVARDIYQAMGLA